MRPVGNLYTLLAHLGMVLPEVATWVEGAIRV